MQLSFLSAAVLPVSRNCPAFALVLPRFCPDPGVIPWSMAQTRKTEAIAALSGRGRRGHSPLYLWLWDHCAEVQQARIGRADWISATEELAALGLTNRDGSPLKPENVRKTWQRVVRDRLFNNKPLRAASPALLMRLVSVAEEPSEPDVFEFHTLRGTSLKSP